jgi:phosphopantothenoylcysteine decarboxylase / phosphopantothenate---cysteine ligase
VTGSVSAYKAALLVRLLVRAGAEVQPIMTRSARRFLGEETLAGLTGRPVSFSMFGSAGEPHVKLGAESDIIVVAPATADVLARIAHGRANDLISATVLCARCPVVFAPAMHPRMWLHPFTQANAERLRSVAGWQLIGPVFGEVASGEHGVGRLAEPEDIALGIVAALSSSASAAEGTALRGSLSARHIVVTAGPTVEDWDPVRYLSNRSSGKMGFALAANAAERGAQVTLIAGPVSLPAPAGVRRIDVRSALDMRQALWSALGPELNQADALVMCAAVSDYRPRQALGSKLKRGSAALVLELEQNPDLLAEVGAARRGARPYLLGFAVESARAAALSEAARAKLAHKRVDAVVANAAEDALGTDTTRAVIVTAGEERWLEPGSKPAVASAIMGFVAEALR